MRDPVYDRPARQARSASGCGVRGWVNRPSASSWDSQATAPAWSELLVVVGGEGGEGGASDQPDLATRWASVSSRPALVPLTRPGQ